MLYVKSDSDKSTCFLFQVVHKFGHAQLSIKLDIKVLRQGKISNLLVVHRKRPFPILSGSGMSLMKTID